MGGGVRQWGWGMMMRNEGNDGKGGEKIGVGGRWLMIEGRWVGWWKRRGR